MENSHKAPLNIAFAKTKPVSDRVKNRVLQVGPKTAKHEAAAVSAATVMMASFAACVMQSSRHILCITHRQHLAYLMLWPT